jgi:ABC-2 type transport system ATP-binding protein
LYNIPKDIFDKRLEKFVSKFGIQDFIDQPVRKLSLGQRMKWEIIASLLHRPKAIFLDEPTVGLDIIAKKVLYEILNEIHKEENITIFLTSHDLNDIENLCDRAVVINRGEILYDGQLEDLMKTYANKKFIRYKEKELLERQEVEIENTPSMIEKTIKHLFENKNIEDLTIENMPLEEVVEEFYR